MTAHVVARLKAAAEMSQLQATLLWTVNSCAYTYKYAYIVLNLSFIHVSWEYIKSNEDINKEY
jgi:hypothetical protein